MPKKSREAFTLIELVVVVGIIALLAMIALPKYLNVKKDAAIAAHNANVRMLKSAALLAIVDEGILKEDTDITEKVRDYIEEWPKVPKGIFEESEKFKDYKIYIGKKQTIKVEPGIYGENENNGNKESENKE